MSTDLIEFIEIENLFIKFANNCDVNKYYETENICLTIEEEIIIQLRIIILTVMKNQKTNYNDCQIKLGKYIIKESLKLLKKINKSNMD